MKLSGINRNCSFSALVIHPNKKEYTEDFLKSYENIVAKAANDKDLYISAEDKIVVQGSDYIITRPIINVAIHPKEIVKSNGKIELDKKYDTVMCMAFSYVPSVKNEKEGKFAEVLQKALSLIG